MGGRLLSSVLIVLALASTAFAQAPADRCDTTAHRQFDFWIGDWEVFERGGTTKAADVSVTSMLGGCVLQEEYSDPGGLHGRSLSSYDTKTRTWQQTWVTNRGQLLVIQGTLQDGAMVFRGWRHDKGIETLVRASWIPEGRNIRETADTSTDGGKTWQPWFDLEFRPAATR